MHEADVVLVKLGKNGLRRRPYCACCVTDAVASYGWRQVGSVEELVSAMLGVSLPSNVNVHPVIILSQDEIRALGIPDDNERN